MASYLQAAMEVVSDIINSGEATSFADFRRQVGQGARPMECSPAVSSAGHFIHYVMEPILNELASSERDFLVGHERWRQLSSRGDLISWASSLLRESGDNVPPAFPGDGLVREANDLATTCLGVARATAGQQAQLLHKNLQFLRGFSVQATAVSEWSPELVFAAGSKLIPDQFWDQGSTLPLVLLVLPLWIRCTGQIGNVLPSSEEEYVDLIVRNWLVRCTTRGDQNLEDIRTNEDQRDLGHSRLVAVRKRQKFSYIVQESDNRFRVMSLYGAVIDGNLRGSALLNQTIAVLSEVGCRDSIPRRPRNRLAAVARRLQRLPETSAYRSVAAQILLRNCETQLTPDPRTLLTSESPLKVMRLIWFISRRNIPTIITLPRFQMCAMTAQSLWFPILHTVLVPTAAVLGFPGPILESLRTAATGGGIAVSSSTPSDEPTVGQVSSELQAALLDPSRRPTVQAECLRVLGCDDAASALATVHAIHGEARAFAVRINAAIECLRELRLMREDILAHTSNAWGSAMACMKACACLYAALGQDEMATQLITSHRLIVNHFAPDIYPWAHAISLCCGCLGGYALCGNSRTEAIAVTFTATSVTASPPGSSSREFTAFVRVPAGIVVSKDGVEIPALPNLYAYCTELLSCEPDGDETICTFKLVEESEEESFSSYGQPAVLPTDIQPGMTWEGSVNQIIVEQSKDNYESCYSQLLSNLNDTLKEYVLNIVRSCSASVPDEVRSARSFQELLEAWDRTVPGAIEPFYVECSVTEEDISAAMGGQSRPPCSAFLDLDAPDGLGAAVTRFNRTDVIRIMCLMSAGGRRIASRSMITARPSAVSMVWAVLRGVNDHDWVKRFINNGV